VVSRQRTRDQITEALADSLIIEFGRRGDGGPTGSWGHYAGVYDPGLAAAFDVEVAALLQNVPELEEAVRTAGAVNARGRLPRNARQMLVRRLESELAEKQRHTWLSLEAMLRTSARAHAQNGFTPQTGRAKGRRSRRFRRWLLGAVTSLLRRGRRLAVPLILLNTIIVLVMAVGPALHLAFGTPLPSGDERVIALSLAATWALAFMPGWLFVRFLDRRAGALWDEYVIHLHRLGLDDHGNLPEPPRTSAYHDDWVHDDGLGRAWLRNIYREKFDAYYGRSVSRFGIDADQAVKPEALFPVFLCTGLLAAGWTAVLYDAQASFGIAGETPGAVLTFAFIGAYLYFIQGLMRRYFQADLRAGAYVSGYVRVVTALLVAMVLNAATPAAVPAEVVVAVAFVVGWFPDVGLRWLMRVASRRLRGAVPSVEPAYPLNRLDGLNLWYETRLLEEGIEDLQTLVTAKVVDVLLHTKVPVARLIDWVDQAVLLTHLPAEPAIADQPQRSLKKRAQAAKDQADKDQHPRLTLRRCGIRSATGLLRALHEGRESSAREALIEHLEQHGMPRGSVLSLRDILAADRRLAVVYNWQNGDAAARRPLPLTALEVVEVVEQRRGGSVVSTGSTSSG